MVSRIKLRLLIFNGRCIDHLSRWTCSLYCFEWTFSIYISTLSKRGRKKRKRKGKGEKNSSMNYDKRCIDRGVNVGSRSFPFELTPVSRERTMLEGLWQEECTTSSALVLDLIEIRTSSFSIFPSKFFKIIFRSFQFFSLSLSKRKKKKEKNSEKLIDIYFPTSVHDCTVQSYTTFAYFYLQKWIGECIVRSATCRQ